MNSQTYSHSKSQLCGNYFYCFFQPVLLFTLIFSTSGYADNSANKTYIIVNNIYKGRISLEFENQNIPCITAPLLREWGMRPQDVSKLTFPLQECVAKSALQNSGILSFYDPQAQLLTLVIPPSLISNIENNVSTSRWNEGINAAFLNYHLNHNHYAGSNYRDAERKESLYADFTAGINLGAWRLRYQPRYEKNTFGNPEWYTQNAQLFRNIKPLRATLTFGDNYSSSAIFDSESYRGFGFSSDDRMIPDGLRPFSPWIHGFAKSNAEVKIRQNDIIIYQTFVAPGIFVLKDVYAIAEDGDLEITVKESDGTETVRKLPYAAMPNLVHYGQWKYDFIIGKHRPYHGFEEPEPSFSQLSLSYGLSKKVTVYGGLMTSPLYQSAVIGIGKSLNQWGATSLDYSFSTARQPRQKTKDRGGVYRLRHAIAFPELESSLSLMAQYYPRNRYRTFSDAISQQQTYWWDWEDGEFTGTLEPEKKYHVEVRYNQYISDADSLYLTWLQESKRSKGGTDSSIEIGYSSSWEDIDISLYATQTRSPYSKTDNQLGISVSIPLNAFLSPRVKFNYDATLAKQDASEHRAGFNGTLLDDYSLSYNLSSTRTSKGDRGYDISGGYQYNAGEVRLGYSRGNGYQQSNAEIVGSVMLHKGGVTLGQELGDTMAVVRIPNTPGIGVDNQYGVTTDSHGYALISNLTPYRVNRLTLDTLDLPENMELPETEIEVVPTSGAIMFSQFEPLRPIEDD